MYVRVYVYVKKYVCMYKRIKSEWIVVKARERCTSAAVLAFIHFLRTFLSDSPLWMTSLMCVYELFMCNLTTVYAVI